MSERTLSDLLREHERKLELRSQVPITDRHVEEFIHFQGEYSKQRERWLGKRMSPLERGAIWFCTVAIVATCAALSMCSPAHGETLATTQSAKPWTLGQCDRLGALGVIHARAVYNVSLWEPKGWPLWRVVCLY